MPVLDQEPLLARAHRYAFSLHILGFFGRLALDGEKANAGSNC